MGYTLADWQKVTNNPLAALALKTISTSDELFSVLPFVPKGGESFEYVREKSLGSFGFVDVMGTPTVSESSGTNERIQVPKYVASADFYLDNFANEESRGAAYMDQLQKKFKVAGRTIADRVINGGHVTGYTLFGAPSGAITALTASAWTDSDRHGQGVIVYTNSGTTMQYRAPGDSALGPAVTTSANGTFTLKSDNPSKWVSVTIVKANLTADVAVTVAFTSSTNEFDGVKKIVDSSMVIASTGTDGDDLAFSTLDALYDLVKVRENLAFFMPAKLRRKYASLCRNLGGTVPEMVMNDSLRVPTFNGIPVLVNDNITADESKGGSSTLSSVYLASLGADEGLYMGALGGDTFSVDSDPRDTAVLGFRVREIGQIEARSKEGHRVEWYGGLALGSTLALARSKEIKTA